MKTIKLMFICVLTATSNTSLAYDFQTLLANFPPSTKETVATHPCIPAEDLDSEQPSFGCKITNGKVTGSDASGRLYALPDGTPAVFPDHPSAPSIVLTELESNTQDILIAGNFIGLPSSAPVKVGVLTDYVLRDTRDDRLVFGMRVVLEPVINGTANQYEINNLFRRGFTGFSAAIGWSRGSDADLRLYSGTRTARKFLSSEPFSFDPDIVRLQSDVNVSEGNARSGYFYIKTDAPDYTTSDNAISLFQAGEEGQPLNEVFLTGFTPSLPTIPATQVPMPYWALFMLAFIMSGMVMRRTNAK